MAHLRLEAFSFAAPNPSQATELRQFIVRNTWMAQSSPSQTTSPDTDTWRTDPRWVLSRPSYNAYLIEQAGQGDPPTRAKWKTIGLAEIIRNRIVINPHEMWSLTGTYVNYMADQEIDRGSDDTKRQIHAAIGRSVLDEAYMLVRRCTAAAQVRTFATIVPDAPHQPVGLAAHMTAHGEPAAFWVPGADSYNIIGGPTVQLYTHIR